MDDITIGYAAVKDAPGILRLLSQVLEIHAAARPDIFIPGTTKYTLEEVESLINDDRFPVITALDKSGDVAGYAICEIKEMPRSQNIIPFRYLYIDDICVDEGHRGRQIGRRIFEFVRAEAEKLGVYEITLNVWEGNPGAKAFYEMLGFTPQKYVMELKLGNKKSEV